MDYIKLGIKLKENPEDLEKLIQGIVIAMKYGMIEKEKAEKMRESLETLQKIRE